MDKLRGARPLRLLLLLLALLPALRGQGKSGKRHPARAAGVPSGERDRGAGANLGRGAAGLPCRFHHPPPPHPCPWTSRAGAAATFL